ncbi:DUF4124 domain-containing protein [Marinobacter mobilis]|uniref:DUF4124 domain-containing protein n=1 Tax=Marinobacter mobilis TaxID=488533 RepID=A0A1H2XK31_9GAMM|nr:DUF4124 domain-containing protein [Marinobacter mobilis]SDW92659.1 protein of unknown function [Marinobacter mobilis]
MNHRSLKGLAPALAATLFLASATADARMYRYHDDNGRLVISNTVPQQASQRGYEILNNQGRVIEVIDPAPTPEEIAAREAAEERLRQAALREAEDRALLKRFSTPEEAVSAMKRKIQELESLSQLKRGNMAVIASQLDAERSRAADFERSGRDVPEATLQKIERLQSQIDDIEREIAQQQDDIESLKARFIDDIRRLEEITGESSSLPPQPSEDAPEPSEP